MPRISIVLAGALAGCSANYSEPLSAINPHLGERYTYRSVFLDPDSITLTLEPERKRFVSKTGSDLGDGSNPLFVCATDSGFSCFRQYENLPAIAVPNNLTLLEWSLLDHTYKSTFIKGSNSCLDEYIVRAFSEDKLRAFFIYSRAGGVRVFSYVGDFRLVFADFESPILDATDTVRISDGTGFAADPSCRNLEK